MVLGVINIGDQQVNMACSADTLRQYRIAYNRDLLSDMQKMKADNINMECLEDMAYIMAKQGDPNMKLPIGEWLDQFGPLDVANAAGDILALWNINTRSASKPKKK